MRRLGYLEGLRGLACLQVFVNHAAQAFWPQLPQLHPLGRLASDGGMAVCLFFLLSGTVLTYAYEKAPADIGRNLIRRLIRLGLPLLAACILAVLIRALIDNAPAEAAAAAGSKWLAQHAPAVTLAGAVRDATIWTVAGYSDTTLFGALSPFLPSIMQSSDGPIWSLHVELWGSAMMLAIVFIARFGVAARWLALVACAAICGMTPIVLFGVGHVLAPLARSDRKRPVLGTLMLLGGVAMAALHQAPAIYAMAHIFNVVALLRPQTTFSLTSLVAAFFIYVGVLHLPIAQQGLASRIPRALGRLSFAIYLLHEPVLLSFGTRIYPGQGAAAAICLSFVVTLLLATMFERWVDQPAIWLSRAFGAHSSVATSNPPASPGCAP